MALTITENFRYTAGGKQFRYVSVTDDETTSTFSAASVGLTWCEYVGNVGFKGASDVANTSILVQHMVATTDGLTIEIGVPADAPAVKKLLLIGW
jgi:hypothetical protein